jgi:hypothetical protein
MITFYVICVIEITMNKLIINTPTCERKTNEANFKNKFKVAGVSTGNNTNINSTYCNGSKPNLNVKFGKK